MRTYEDTAHSEMMRWKKRMQKPPSLLNNLTHNTQKKINSIIPEKVHEAITKAMKGMIRAVLFGAKYTTSKPLSYAPLQVREEKILSTIDSYRKTGAAEGGITGAGGFLMSLADFPILIGIKMKMLFQIASLYGFDTKDYRERLFLLHVFQLAFSSQHRRNEVFTEIENWDLKVQELPDDIHAYDWRKLQQEYRDYIDLAKLAQLIPFVGAAVGAIANYKLVGKLGETAMQAYRMRLFSMYPKGLIS
ncbi:MAG: EcsC family protein [Mucilaginibacter polytrichastri]|nr:EcsC family protein [Mucilaginibacter polytrichastri]